MAPKLLGTLKLDRGWSHELLLHGDRLLVLSRGGYWAEPLPALAGRSCRAAVESVLTEIDVSKPAALRVVETLSLDGSTSRHASSAAPSGSSSSSQVPVELPYQPPTPHEGRRSPCASKQNRAVVASSRRREAGCRPTG